MRRKFSTNRGQTNQNHTKTLFHELKEKKNINNHMIKSFKFLGGTSRNERMKTEKSQNYITEHSISQMDKETEWSTSHMLDKLTDLIKYVNMYPGRKTNLFSKKTLTQSKTMKEVRFQRKQRKTQTKTTQVDEDLFFKFFDESYHNDENINSKRLSRKMKELKKLIHKRTQQKRQPSYSIHNFVKEQRKFLQKQKRKSKYYDQPYPFQNSYDLRQQNVKKLLQFVKGAQVDETEEYTQYFSLRKLSNQTVNSSLMRRINNKITQNIKGHHINLNEIHQNSMKNVLYINQRIRTEGSSLNKKVISSMARMKLIK